VTVPEGKWAELPIVRPGTGGEDGLLMFERIWAPYDGSPRSDAGVELATKLARATGARLALVHVDPEPEDAPIEDPLGVAKELLGLAPTTSWEARLAGMAARIPDVEVEVVVTEGDPPSTLLDLLHAEPPDLVVVGARRPLWTSRFPGRSVTDALVHHAPCPVVVAR
jgi:nucleotide-binding universal stress UspA family protein